MGFPQFGGIEGDSSAALSNVYFKVNESDPNHRTVV